MIYQTHRLVVDDCSNLTREVLSLSPKYVAALKLGKKSFVAQVVVPDSSRIASSERIPVVLTKKILHNNM